MTRSLHVSPLEELSCLHLHRHERHGPDAIPRAAAISGRGTGCRHACHTWYALLTANSFESLMGIKGSPPFSWALPARQQRCQVVCHRQYTVTHSHNDTLSGSGLQAGTPWEGPLRC